MPVYRLSNSAMKHFYCFCLSFFLIITTASPFGNYFVHINGKDGLSHNNVKSIIQDSYGFMWFGTRNKLNRYDGTSIKIFDCFDSSTHKRNNNISALFENSDHKLWVGTDNGVFIFDPICESFHSFDSKTSDNQAIAQWIADIQKDDNNNIWIVVPNQGVFKFNLDSKILKLYSVVNKLAPSKTNPQCISIEKNGRVWIGTNGQGVFLYNENKDSFTQYNGSNQGGESLLNKNIYTMCHINEDLIIGVHEGCLMKLDTRKNHASNMHIPQVDYKIIRDIILFDDVLWIGTQNGITEINLKTNKIKQTQEDLINQYSLSDNIIEKIYKDKEGGIWVGTNFGGVNYLPNSHNNFEKYLPNSSSNLNSISKRIREIAEDADGRIWLGTEDAGVIAFDTEKQEFKQITHSSRKKTLAMLMKDNDLWVGYFKDGLDVINKKTGAIKHYSAEMLGINEESIYALCEDRYGKVWLGNAWGVFVAEKGSMQFKRMDIFGLCYTYNIIEDSEGFIWVACLGSGVFQYNPLTNEIHHYTNNGEINSISSNAVSSITEDHSGQIWFSTDRGGICKFNKKQKQFTSYSIKEGLPDDIAYKILEDKNYNLWFGTNKGLVKFNSITHNIRVYTQSDGLLSEEFNYNSGIVSRSGKLYLGSMEGLVAFRPEEFKDNNFVPPVYITRFSIFNKEVNHIPSSSESTGTSIIHAQKLEIKYNQSNISFDFVSLSYTSPQSNMYAYKMENVDKEWIYTKDSHSASYANLSPGTYTFKVKGSNNDGVWNETGASIEIVISPPWWLSNIARILYILSTFLIFYTWWRWYSKRIEKDATEARILSEAEKDKELYKAKVNFFTNIAHEIRTPITLINGPLESLIELNLKDEDVRYNLSIIERNTKQLLELINQILDFRKIDDNKFYTYFQNININQLLDNIIIQFEKEINLKQKKLTINKDNNNPIIARIDKDAISKIISNLLSNAIKYSSQIIAINLYQNEANVQLTILNDGTPVPEEFKDKIFDPFFQVNNPGINTFGSGIGLSLAMSLVKMHDGTLTYEYDNDLNKFTLNIPLNLIEEIDTPAESHIVNEEDHTEDEIRKSSSAETILLVEDHKEMQLFMYNKLRNNYNVEIADNGKEAQFILKKKSINIIISDIMMPEMDGFELCKYIKKSSEYNHIIVILLTAKNDLSSKIKGLELGADAYVEKPFSFSYLETLIISLVNNKKRDMEIFLKKPFLTMIHSGMSKGDEIFLNSIIDIIDKNITDTDLNVEKLADLMKLSRSSLHRKLKAVTDSSPVDFIRLVRMQKAAQIIQDGEHRINEVCYLVGINSPSYFTKLFSSQYGMTPKEFERQQKGK